MTTPTVLLLMGVSGSGKTTVGMQLAQRLGWVFKEGDDLHPAANIAKMQAAEPLTDADREPWLAAVAAWIDGWINAHVCGVITCSALKRSYRRRLVAGRPGVAFVFLHGGQSVLAERLAKRRGHFMPPSLLASQLATLEAPTPDEPVIPVDSGQPIASQVDAVVTAITARDGQIFNTGHT
jgi:carbohydrate kinase (thermoresistant glucokinase family)